MQKLGVPGVSIAVIRDFEIHWSNGYGLADVTAGTKVTPDTLFQAASISKPVAAMAVLKAVQDGRFTLDQDVNTILTSWKVPASEHTARQPVTLRGLLSHTSGTDDGFGFPGYKPGAPVPTLVQILNGEPPSNVGTVIVARPPLTAFKYSGGGVTLVQLLMTDAMKRPFPEMMRDTVLTPLGMTQQRLRATVVGRARSHTPPARTIAPAPRATSSGTSIRSSPPRGYGPRRRISRGSASRSRNRSRADRIACSIARWRTRWRVRSASDRSRSACRCPKRGEGWYLDHGGSNWGFQCLLFVHKIKGYGFAAMTNGDAGGRLIAELQQRVAAAYKWDMLDQPLRR